MRNDRLAQSANWTKTFGYSAHNKERKIKRPNKTKEVKRTNYKADFNHLMNIQNGLCAYPWCKQLHQIRQKVHSIKDLDHKTPIKLWQLKNKLGNPNSRSNLQLICPGCHQHKTAEDRKKISQYKHNHKTMIKSVKKQKKSKTISSPRQKSSMFLADPRKFI